MIVLVAFALAAASTFAAVPAQIEVRAPWVRVIKDISIPGRVKGPEQDALVAKLRSEHTEAIEGLAHALSAALESWSQNGTTYPLLKGTLRQVAQAEPRDLLSLDPTTELPKTALTRASRVLVRVQKLTPLQRDLLLVAIQRWGWDPKVRGSFLKGAMDQAAFARNAREDESTLQAAVAAKNWAEAERVLARAAGNGLTASAQRTSEALALSDAAPVALRARSLHVLATEGKSELSFWRKVSALPNAQFRGVAFWGIASLPGSEGVAELKKSAHALYRDWVSQRPTDDIQNPAQDLKAFRELLDRS